MTTASMQDRFYVLTEAAPVGMFETDAAGDCLYTNPAWCTITGVSQDDAVGRGWEQILHPEDAATVVRDWDTAQAAQTEYHERFRILAYGDTRWIEVRAVPTVAEGRVLGWVGTFVDVTASVEAERATDQARDRALEASRLKSAFVANISHEIRTPLNAVLGLAEILADTSLDEKQLAYVDTLRRAGADLLTLLNDVLDLSKMEAGAMSLDVAPFDLVELVRNTAELFTPSASCKGLGFEVDLTGAADSHLVGDAARMRQVLSNLISNAIKFTDDGNVGVRATTTRSGEAVDVRIAVEDTGMGVRPEDRDRIFDLFGQADSSPTRRCRGSGLGLSISRQILDLMDGRIEVQPNGSRGSVFLVTLRLPVHGSDVPAPVVQPNPVRATRVLVVEDNAVNQLVLQTILKQQGCDVDVADNGQIGVEFATERAYDLVFMDCQMPVMDGYEATAAIRQLEGEHRLVPIVALTASAMPADRDRCLAAGMDDYLSKPVAKAALSAVLTRFGAAASPPPRKEHS